MNITERPEQLKRAQTLTAGIEGELTKRQGAKTVLGQMQRSALADLKAELAELAELLGMARHKLVFIGQVGVGKTTAICHLVGLTANREKKKTVRGNENTFPVVERLMATGSGYTTLCEVVVEPSDKTRFEIDPYPRTEVEQTISDFCITTWKKVYPDSTEAGQKEVNFPPELVRAVRNMVKLPEGERSENDQALKLAREFDKDAYEQFRMQVLSQAKLDTRVVTELECPAAEADPRAWIKKTFDGINLAHLESVSIPRRITFRVDAKLLNPHMAKVAAVVDTKGVDPGGFNREDLDRYIRLDKGAVCILAEAFKPAPSNVMPLLQRHITPEAPLSSAKFVLMVLPQSGEPEDVMGGQGTVGEREPGLNIRRGQIDDTLTSRGLNGLNVLFFDPLQYFERSTGSDFALRSDNTLEEVQAERDEAWAAIFKAIETRENRIWERITQIGDSFQKISEGKSLNPAEEALVRQARASIAEYRHITMANAERFFELFRALWEGSSGRHVMTLRATNNRYGLYPPRNIDIYYDAVPITEQLVRTAASRPKEAVLAIVRAAKSNSSPNSDLRELLTVLETRIDSSFENMVREVGVAMHDYLSDTALAPQDSTNAFWTNVQVQFGKGGGYRDTVLSMYAAQLDGHQEVLIEAAEECWQRVVIDPVLAYLAED